MSISQVQWAGPKIGKIPRPIPAPKSIPDPGETKLDFEQQQPESDPDFNDGSRSHGDLSYERLSGPNGDFAVPTLEELGLPAATSPHRGGETIALEMLDKSLRMRDILQHLRNLIPRPRHSNLKQLLSFLLISTSEASAYASSTGESKTS
jgi:hypothetical protein